MFLEVAEAYCHALTKFGDAAGADIFSAPHRRLHEIVHNAGGSYKPSGAGGGDFGIALTTDPGGREAIVRAVTEAGFCAIDLGLATSGVSISGKR